MLAFENFVYLDLEKTACTFLRDTLKIICVDLPLEDRKHAPLVSMTDKPRIMTIRHPLSYFLSLWKYGLEGRGSFFDAYHASHPQAYAERSPRSFKFFLNLALTAGGLGVGGEMMSTDIYTLRIINQLVPISERARISDGLNGDLSPQSLVLHMSEFVPDVLLRTDSLNRDFHAMADADRLAFMQLKENWKALFPLDAKKTNFSIGETETEMSFFYDEWHRQRVLFSSGLALWLYERGCAKVP